MRDGSYTACRGCEQGWDLTTCVCQHYRIGWSLKCYQSSPCFPHKFRSPYPARLAPHTQSHLDCAAFYLHAHVVRKPLVISHWYARNPGGCLPSFLDLGEPPQQRPMRKCTNDLQKHANQNDINVYHRNGTIAPICKRRSIICTRSFTPESAQPAAC